MTNISNLEQDLLKTQWIKIKCLDSEAYAQNLYAALCNNTFVKNNDEWNCSWRVSADIVAALRGIGEDYMSFYCSGVGSGHIQGYVRESYVTSEVSNDLLNLGWCVKPQQL